MDKQNFSSDKDKILTEICKRCAVCCKNYPFVELSQTEIISLEKATGVHPDLFTNPKGKEIEEYFLQFQDNGYCCFLTEKDGGFSCGVYESRPLICKNFPSEPAQQDVCDANSERLLSNVHLIDPVS